MVAIFKPWDRQLYVPSEARRRSEWSLNSSRILSRTLASEFVRPTYYADERLGGTIVGYLHKSNYV